MLRTNLSRRLHLINKAAGQRIRWCCGLFRSARKRIRANETAANVRIGAVTVLRTDAKPTQVASVEQFVDWFETPHTGYDPRKWGSA